MFDLDAIFADCVRGEEDLYEDQREATEFLWENRSSALFLDVGMGKTVITYNIFDRLWTRGYSGKFLIVAPIRVATRVWPYEPRLWRHLAYMRTAVIRIPDDDPRLKAAYKEGYDYGKAKGYDSDMCRKIAARSETAKKHSLLEALLDSPEQIHIINREAVKWLVEAWSKRGGWPYKVVVVDEASVLGDHNNEIFKALKRVRKHIKRFHELTASPASQTYMRFFSQVFLLDEGERFGSHITPFRERYFTHSPYTKKWTLRPGADVEIEKKIADIVLVMRRDKDFRVNIRPIRLSRELMQGYRDFERDLVLELPDDVTIDAINGGVLANKLLQYASGAVYDTKAVLDPVTGDPILDSRGGAKLKRIYHLLHDEKIEDLKSLEEETLDHPVMVAYWYKSSLERLREAFPKAAVMDREGKLEEPWNQRKFKFMLVHPRGVAHGLNLQRGGHHIALFDIFWPLDLFTQIIGRLDRDGQTDTVMVHMLSAVGTMDETVSLNLQVLQSAEEAMFRRLQALRRRYKNDRSNSQPNQLHEL